MSLHACYMACSWYLHTACRLCHTTLCGPAQGCFTSQNQMWVLTIFASSVCVRLSQCMSMWTHTGCFPTAKWIGNHVLLSIGDAHVGQSTLSSSAGIPRYSKSISAQLCIVCMHTHVDMHICDVVYRDTCASYFLSNVWTRMRRCLYMQYT
jgi:hypothetical protein